MKKILILGSLFAVSLALGLTARPVHAADCSRERDNMEAAGHHADRICSGPDTEATLSACQFAFGVFMEAAAQYEQCMQRDSNGPLG